jgi:hypothetical protein
VSAERASRTKLLLSLLLAVAIFAFLLRRVDVAGTRAEIQEMTWVELVTIALLAGWNLVTYWVLWMTVTPGLRLPQAATLAQSGTAVTNTVPGGSGIGVGLAYKRIERLLGRLTRPPSVSYLGWSSDPHPRGRRRWRLRRRRFLPVPYVLPAKVAAAHRLPLPPEWGYQVDFQADAGSEPLVPGRSGPAHQRALRLRAENRWSFMHTVVGRNNLGDIEFLPGVGGEPGMAPDLVRQSLWFDKTSIRSGAEPERLPYTVYDLPLAPAPPEGHVADVR